MGQLRFLRLFWRIARFMGVLWILGRFLWLFRRILWFFGWFLRIVGQLRFLRFFGWSSSPPSRPG